MELEYSYLLPLSRSDLPTPKQSTYRNCPFPKMLSKFSKMTYTNQSLNWSGTFSIKKNKSFLGNPVPEELAVDLTRVRIGPGQLVDDRQPVDVVAGCLLSRISKPSAATASQ